MNNYIKSLIFFSIFAGAMIYAQTGSPVYISPNNDGIQDELIIPLSIKDKRYISEWNFVVLDEGGKTVRSIGNKEKRPEKLTFKGFFQQLFKAKQGVIVPETVIWNGIMDTGETAPDGIYRYFVSAKDDNGNESKTPQFVVVVDNTPPHIEISPVSESAKIFGAGNKPEIAIKQGGSVEDLWTAQVTDNTGKIIRTFKWENAAPDTCTWDGKDENGLAVAEGVYAYKIFASDKAGNLSAPAQVTNIIYDAIPRSINMLVRGSPFSPNGDGVQDTITILPTMSSSGGLLNWSIEAINKENLVVYSTRSTEPPSAAIEFNGKDSKGKTLSDGDYQLVFTASFSNGQESRITRNITVDNTPPSAIVRSDGQIFSPDSDGRLDTITINQEGSKERNWKGSIIDESGKTVKSWNFGASLPSSLLWDGVSDAGKITDGFYKYVLSATDLAGNTGSAATAPFELNTGTTEIILTVHPDAFSPNGDKVQDSIAFTPQVRTNTGIASYVLSILDSNGAKVKTFAEKRSLPAALTWNGLSDEGARCADGAYTASLYTLSKNGSESTITTQPFLLDTRYPEVSLTAPYTVFSPNGDKFKDSLPLSISTTSESLWTAAITDKNKNTVRSFIWEGKALPFDWDGKDEAGNTVGDGAYTFTIQSTDKAGNKAIAEIKNITVDTRSPKTYITAEREAFSPNNDGKLDSQQFTIRTSLTEGIESWMLNITNTASGETVRTWNQADQADVPAVITWDGKGSNGAISEGLLTANLSIKYAKGDSVSASTAPFLCSVTPPKLTVRTAPEYFSPDNDGIDDDLFINLQGKSLVPFTSWSFEIKDPTNGNPFWKTSGKAAITERIIWDGRSNNGELVQSAMDYPYEFTVKDSLGMSSTVKGLIPVDVLVIRIGDVLKMQVPAIIFRSDNADFKGKDEDPQRGLERSVIDNNIRVLKRIAEILNKFRDYKVTIEGHANNISGTEEEETSTAKGNIPLVPLSEARAQTVKTMLSSYGVNSSRLSTVGRGGRMPVAARADRDNWWKNRRVEFILNK